MNNTKTVGSVASSAKKKNTRPASLDKRKARAGWFFVLPFIVGFVLIYLPIIFDSIKFSFHEIDPVRTGGYTLTWVGLQNYQKALFEDADYVKTLVSGMQQLILEVPSIVIFSLFIAVLLNDKIAGRAAFRAILFVPVILSTGLIESIDAQNNLMEFMDSEAGIDDGTGQSAAAQLSAAIDLEALFANMKVGTGLVEYVASAVDGISTIINRSGVQILIFLAGLQSISPAIYESCKIDGATGAYALVCAYADHHRGKARKAVGALSEGVGALGTEDHIKQASVTAAVLARGLREYYLLHLARAAQYAHDEAILHAEAAVKALAEDHAVLTRQGDAIALTHGKQVQRVGKQRAA